MPHCQSDTYWLLSQRKITERLCVSACITFPGSLDIQWCSQQRRELSKQEAGPLLSAADSLMDVLITPEKVYVLNWREKLLERPHSNGKHFPLPSRSGWEAPLKIWHIFIIQCFLTHYWSSTEKTMNSGHLEGISLYFKVKQHTWQPLFGNS